MDSFIKELDGLTSALTNPVFYMELLFVGLSLALSWLIAVLVRRRVAHYLSNHTPRNLSAESITKPLSLLGPLLAIIYLGIFTPLVEQYTEGSLIGAVMKLSVAYLVARGVILIVHTRPIAYFIAVIIMLIGVLRATDFLHPVLIFLKGTELEIGKFKLSMLNLVHGIVILVVVFWLAAAISRTLENYLRKSSTLNYSTRELIVKFFRLFIYFLALLITLSAMGVDLTAFAVFGGAVGVGIGFGLQKISANFISGITLLIEKSIKIGDLIEVGGTLGWVRQLNIRYTLVETLDGRAILVPNDELTSSRVTSWTYTDNSALIDIKIGVGYDADVKKAHMLMMEAVQQNPRCQKDPKPSCYLREFGELGVVFSLSFWISDVRQGRQGVQSEVMFSIIEKFRAAGIEFRIKQM